MTQAIATEVKRVKICVVHHAGSVSLRVKNYVTVERLRQFVCDFYGFNSLLSVMIYKGVVIRNPLTVENMKMENWDTIKLIEFTDTVIEQLNEAGVFEFV